MITRFFCRKCRDYALFCRKCRDYALFGVEFWQKFWQKVLEILRILAEILRKKLACGASGPYFKAWRSLLVLGTVKYIVLPFFHGLREHFSYS